MNPGTPEADKQIEFSFNLQKVLRAYRNIFLFSERKQFVSRRDLLMIPFLQHNIL